MSSSPTISGPNPQQIQGDNKLPWDFARLGDHTLKIGSGVTPRGGNASYLESGVPLIRSQNVHMNRFEPAGLAFISEEQDADMAASRVQPGDVLLNITGASIGRVCVVPDEFTPANVNQHVTIIRSDGSWIPEFLSYYFSSPAFQELINDGQAGATRQALTKSLIESFEFPFLPLPEQDRIAAELTSALVTVNRALRAAESRLAAAEALPACFLREVFERNDTGWPSRRLGDLLIRHNEIIHPGDGKRGEAEFVGLEHIESHTGRRIGSQTIDLTKLTGRKPTFRKGQILYGYLRPYLNKVWIAEFDGCSSVDQFAFEVRSDIADTQFIAAFMRSETFLRRSAVVTTTGQLPRISIDEIASVNVELPSDLAIQRQIVRDLYAHLDNCQALIAHCREELEAIESLPNALLRAAFEQGHVTDG